MTVIKPKDMKIGDVVAYYRKDGQRMPFGDMVVMEETNDGKGWSLWRPFVSRGPHPVPTAAVEPLYWGKDSNMEFFLLRRD